MHFSYEREKPTVRTGHQMPALVCSAPCSQYAIRPAIVTPLQPPSSTGPLFVVLWFLTLIQKRWNQKLK